MYPIFYSLNLVADLRYHEEQIWSDKIRRASTWGTFALMGVNVLLFVVVQVGLEPWRRGRLVRGFEEKVLEAVGQIPSRTIEELPIVVVEQIQQGPIEQDTNSMASQTNQKVIQGEEEIEVVVSGEDIAVEGMQGVDVDDGEQVIEKTDIWISAASGAVLGSIITALATYLLSR